MSGEMEFYLVAVPAVILLGLSKGGFHRLELARDADAVAGHLAGQGGGDRAAHPHRAGLGQRLGLPPRLFAAQPRDPHPLVDDRRRRRLAARGAGQRGRGEARGRAHLDRLRRLHAGRATGSAARRSRRPGLPGGLLWGSLAGFTSFISHAGAPPFQVYVMPQNLKPRVFAGTATMFFAAVNLIKVPPYFLLGQFSRDNLAVSAGLIPVAVLSTFAGVWLVRRVSADRFYAIILIITFLIGVKLTYDAVQALFDSHDVRRQTAAVRSALAPPREGRIAAQIPSFAVIGLVGYVVDAAITYAGAKYLGLSPELARPPGFVVATVVNFLLNRAITFRHSQAPLVRAFVRYCAVASAGLAVNYAVYSACVLLAPRFGSR